MSNATGGPAEDTADSPKPGRGPLDGIRVVELATVLMGPYAGQLLGDMGADVIKVEGDVIDPGRQMGGGPHEELSGTALNLHRNKRSVHLDLRTPAGMQALRELLRSADVLLINLRPRSMKKLGLDYASVAEIAPRLVYCEAHGYRSDSDEGDLPAFDDIIQAGTGWPALLETVSGTPHFIPSAIADKVAGLAMVNAVLAALVHRNASGRGQRVEIPMADTMLGFTLVEHLGRAVTPGEPAGYTRILSPHRGPHKTADGYIAVLPYSDDNWRAFYRAVGREEEMDQPWHRNMPIRHANADQAYSGLADILRTETTQYWVDLCTKIGVPVGLVRTVTEIVEDPEAHRGVLSETSHPEIGPYRQINPTTVFGDTPASVRRPAPLIGQHTTEVLLELGIDQDTIDTMLESGAARQTAGS